MLRLDSTVRKLQIVLGGAITTNQLPVVVCFSDKTTTAYTGGTTVSNTNSTTAVDIVAAPAASTVRDIDSITVQNADTAAATATIRYNDNGTTYTLFKATLAVGDQVIYTHGQGWKVFDSSGNLKSSGSGSGTGDVVGPASSTDNAIVRFDGATGKLVQNSGVIVDDSNNVTVPGSVLISTVDLIGYTTGAGGAVTQLTSKTTAVTLDTPCGQITTNNAALGSGVAAVFTVNNSLCSATDVVILNITSGVSGFDNYLFWANPNAGGFNIVVYNRTAGSLSEAIVFNFAIIKAVAS